MKRSKMKIELKISGLTKESKEFIYNEGSTGLINPSDVSKKISKDINAFFLKLEKENAKKSKIKPNNKQSKKQTP